MTGDRHGDSSITIECITHVSKNDAPRTNGTGEVVSVSSKGQATIPKRLRERHGIDAPGKVRMRENEDGEIVVEPVPSIRGMRGAASEGWGGTALLEEGRSRDERRDERLSGRETPDEGG